MSTPTIAFLGPEGTFAHLAARTRYGKKSKLVPRQSVREVFDFVAGGQSRLGVVPIENSSGGTILDTVDCLVERDYDGLFIRESLAVDVKLALMGRSGSKIKVIYSHFAPLHHCRAWLEEKYPHAKQEKVASTAIAVRAASKDKGAAAIGNRMAGEIYGLEVLEFPIGQDGQNVTQFFVLGHKRNTAKEKNSRTSLVVTLPNTPGSLVDFLEPFKNHGLNLTRIISRPIAGQPETHAFLADIGCARSDRNVQKALKAAEKVASHLRLLGTYPVRERYTS